MKFDASFGSAKLSQAAAVAQAAEALGIDGLWSMETAHNPFLPLALAAANTQRIELGTSIALAFPRSPMITAQLAWDLADLSGGRFILGMGTQVKAHITKRFSTTWDSPGPRLREYILSLRAIWDSFQNNTPLNFKGEFYKFSLLTPFFSPGRIEKPAVPIHIAGVNAYLCQLAGELCQGFHVHPFHTVRYVREAILPNIEKGLVKAGRKRQDIQLTSAAFVVTGETERDMENAKGAVKSQIAFYASTPSYEPVLAVHGWEGVGQTLNALARQGQWAEMADAVPDDMLHEFAVVAPYDQLAQRVCERYQGLLDRIAYYLEFEPEFRTLKESVWQDAVKTFAAV